MEYILASASPRRKELLQQAGLAFRVMPARKEETLAFEIPQEAVLQLSGQKAEEVAHSLAGEKETFLIIGADTIVAHQNEIFGKPKNKEDALSMLCALQGDRHTVYTGVTVLLLSGEKAVKHSFYEKTEVFMYPAAEEELKRYLDTGEPLDKAGAYGIQGKGAVFIRKIEGDYNNVVGFPLSRFYQELKKLGIDIYA